MLRKNLIPTSLPVAFWGLFKQLLVAQLAHQHYDYKHDHQDRQTDSGTHCCFRPKRYGYGFYLPTYCKTPKP